MAECTFAYPAPNDFDAAVSNVVNYFTGGSVDTGCFIHCGWVVSGYTLNMIFPHEHPVITYSPDLKKCENKDELVTALLQIQSARTAGYGAITFDWKSVAVMMLQLLLEFLKQQ